jgi:hypothetical protein
VHYSGSQSWFIHGGGGETERTDTPTWNFRQWHLETRDRPAISFRPVAFGLGPLVWGEQATSQRLRRKTAPQTSHGNHSDFDGNVLRAKENPAHGLLRELFRS